MRTRTAATAAISTSASASTSTFTSTSAPLPSVDGPSEHESDTTPISKQFTAGPASELWIFDGLDNGSVPYEISLPHPRTGRLTTFALGLKKDQPVIGEVRVFRSGLPTSFLTVTRQQDLDIADTTDATGENAAITRTNTEKQCEAIISPQDLKVVTEIDPVFITLPFLVQSSSHAGGRRDDGKKAMFLQLDDLLDRWRAQSAQVDYLVEDHHAFGSHPQTRSSMTNIFESALARCCETVAAGDEKMYRFSVDKFFTIVLDKAQKLVVAGLPPSLEDVAKRSVEESGGISLKRADSETVSIATPGPLDTEDSQTSTTSSVFSQAGQGSDASEMGSTSQSASQELQLMRLRLAFSFILTNYVPSSLCKQLLVRLDKPTDTTTKPKSNALPDLDFAPLRERLTAVQEQRSAALAAQNMVLSLKRGGSDEDEMAEERAEKRRRKEEEEKRRKSQSTGVKQLAKVNTNGMKKLSSFFAAKPKAK